MNYDICDTCLKRFEQGLSNKTEMEYKGLREFKVEHNYYDEVYIIVEINFDHPYVMKVIRQIVDKHSSIGDLKMNDGDYVETFLQLIAHISAKMSQDYNISGLQKHFANHLIPVDGSKGVKIIESNSFEIESREFIISDYI